VHQQRNPQTLPETTATAIASVLPSYMQQQQSKDEIGCDFVVFSRNVRFFL
jgi:hypothetical protein